MARDNVFSAFPMDLVRFENEVRGFSALILEGNLQSIVEANGSGKGLLQGLVT